MKELCIAHRGLHNVYFENTKGAFLDAGKGPYFGIETDIHHTLDNVWVCHHNSEILSKGKLYKINDYNYEEIKDLILDNNQNDNNAKICLLEDYLRICKDSNKRPIIEVKDAPKWKYFLHALEIIEKEIGIENVTIISFHPRVLVKSRKKYGEKVHLQQLIKDKYCLMKSAIFYHMDIDASVDTIEEKHVKKMHKKGLKVNVWTVDTNEQYLLISKIGVDYITSNTLNSNYLK